MISGDEMNTLKNIFLVLTISAQLAAIILVFVNIRTALALLAIYVFALIVLFGLLIKERSKEKEEEKHHDYRHY